MANGWPILVTVLTGFLGAGKTTLLNRLLKDPALNDAAVIVNEFGEVGIDHLLVESATEGIIELSGGCLCCTVRGDLVDTLADLAERMQTGKVRMAGRVLIETTGLADPVPVLMALMGHPAMVEAFRLDGVVTVLDAVNGAATIDRHEEALRQLAVADRVVITKADIAEVEELAALRARIEKVNPAAPQLDASGRDVDAISLFGAGLADSATLKGGIDRWLGATRGDGRECCGHDGHGHHHHHHHGDHDHHPHVRRHVLVHERPLPLASVEAFFDLLRSVHGEGLLRMKGIVEIAEDRDRPLVLHGVQKLLHPPARLAAWPDDQRGTRLVLITSGIPDDYVHRLFDAFTGTPRTDTPDAAALSANPLAIPGFS